MNYYFFTLLHIENKNLSCKTDFWSNFSINYVRGGNFYHRFAL